MEKQNWFREHWIFTGVSVLIFIVALISSINDDKRVAVQKEEFNKLLDSTLISKVEQSDKIAFDLNGMSWKKLADYKQKFPEAKVTDTGAYSQDKDISYTTLTNRSGEIAIYHYKGSKAVTFVSIFPNKGETLKMSSPEDKLKLLRRVGLKADTPEYKISFEAGYEDVEKDIRTDTITRLDIINMDPLEDAKTYKARELGDNIKLNIPLKSPSTADYSRTTAVATDRNVYSVFGHIDSQNSFGALVRTYWSATYTFNGNETEADVKNISNWKMSGLKVN